MEKRNKAPVAIELMAASSIFIRKAPAEPSPGAALGRQRQVALLVRAAFSTSSLVPLGLHGSSLASGPAETARVLLLSVSICLRSLTDEVYLQDDAECNPNKEKRHVHKDTHEAHTHC